MESKYSVSPKSAQCTDFVLNEVDYDFLRRMPFTDQTSFGINDVLMVAAVESVEQCSDKKVTSSCVTLKRAVWTSVSLTVWYQLSFFVESATERNMYLDMLDCLLSRKLQTLKAKRKLQLFSEGTVPHSVSVARRDVP